MKKNLLGMLALAFLAGCAQPKAGGEEGSGVKAHNPVIFADVRDVAMVRVGEVYYMASTTMHMNPGLPIMKSTDLVNWELVSYASAKSLHISQKNWMNDPTAKEPDSGAPLHRHNGAVV